MVSEPKAVARRRKLRDALIHAAERTIEKEGLGGMRARELAQKVGCAVGAIYNVFTDLDDLIFAVNARTLEHLEKTLTLAGEKGGDDDHRRPREGWSSRRRPAAAEPLDAVHLWDSCFLGLDIWNRI